MASLLNDAPVNTIAVRLTNWVGDCVMNTPFLARLRSIFPDARIVCVGRKNVAGLLQSHPHVDDVWTIDDKSTGGFFDAAKRLRGLHADMGFLLPNSLKSASLFVAGRVKRRVGYDRDGRRLFLTHPITLRPEDLAVHEAKYYLRLLHDWESKPAEPPPLLLTLTDDERRGMNEWLAQEGVGADDFVIGVNPAAFFGTAKRWPADRFATVASEIAATRKAVVVVTGLAQEKDVAQAVCDAGSGARFVNAAGRMSLRQLMAFLARCQLFLTNDSGAMHIAAALGTPLVAVFGSTDWVTTAPLSTRA
ncbi:lipopolysaccharide heptosyltransferase II [soil metagenome]